jgi:hypothetical protein
MRTINGSPASEGYAWNEKTYQEFGNIVYLLSRSDNASRKQGYIKYYEFRHNFVFEVFNEMIDRLETFRIERGFKTITDLLSEIKGELIEDDVKNAEESSPEIPLVIPTQASFIQPEEKIVSKNKVVQLSLF